VDFTPWRPTVLVLTRKVDESIKIGNQITVSVLEIKGNQVRLGIDAPKTIPINRTEIYENIIRENIEASKAPRNLDIVPESLNPRK
jgi:carbon storage regulator